MRDIFEGESKIRKIGGRVEDDYYSFANSVLFVNANIIPLFFMLGFNHPEDKDFIVGFLSESVARNKIKEAYIDHVMKQVADGEIRLDSLLSSCTINKQLATPEEKQKQINRCLHQVLSLQYSKIHKEYTKKYRPSLLGYWKAPFITCGESLKLTDKGLEIDVDKFIGIYQRFIEADESEHKKLHQLAADAINRFFNGSVEATQAELERYFIIDAGIIKPNPKSISVESYMRLGFRYIKNKENS
jgi:hypothetical protein